MHGQDGPAGHLCDPSETPLASLRRVDELIGECALLLPWLPQVGQDPAGDGLGETVLPGGIAEAGWAGSHRSYF